MKNATQTTVQITMPWGLYGKYGNRLLCSDGVIRAARLAPTPDTFFSVPASVRVKGKHVSGYYTKEGELHAFRHHTVHSDKLPVWPNEGTPEFAEVTKGKSPKAKK